MTGGVLTAVVVVGAFGFGADAAVGAGIIGPTSGAGGGFETVDGVVAELVAWVAVTAAGRPLIEDRERRELGVETGEVGAELGAVAGAGAGAAVGGGVFVAAVDGVGRAPCSRRRSRCPRSWRRCRRSSPSRSSRSRPCICGKARRCRRRRRRRRRRPLCASRGGP